MADNPGKKVFLTEAQLDSVKVLSEINQCIYLMESLTAPGVFRFGGIGIKQNRANTAIRRLGQCTHTLNGSVIKSWKYIAMLQFEPSAGPGCIRRHENQLRNILFDHSSIYYKKRIGKTDSIRINGTGNTLTNCRIQLINKFKEVLRNYN